MALVWHCHRVWGCGCLFPAAYRAAVPDLTPADALPSANALTDLSATIGGVLGPLCAASLIAFGGVPLAFLLDGLSFVVSIVCLLPVLKHASPPPRDTGSRGLLDDMRVGVRTVAGSAWLWVTIAVAGMSNLTYVGPMSVALPFLICDHLHADVGMLGLFYAVQSVGAVLGAIWLGRRTHVRRRGLAMYGVWIVTGLTVLIMGLTTSIPLILAAACVFGAANTLLGLIWINSVQAVVPRALQGRVSSIDYLGSSLLEPVGLAIGGWATALLGPALVFIIGGAAQALLVALGLLHAEVRQFD